MKYLKQLLVGLLISTLCLSGVFVQAEGTDSSTPAATETGSFLIADINQKVASITMASTLDDIIRLFGEPSEYIWGDATYTKDNLPQIYIAQVAPGFSTLMNNGHVVQIRFSDVDTGYVYKDRLKIGSTLDEALEVLGQPLKTVDGQELGMAEDGVLYKNIGGQQGFDYYSIGSQGISLFFMEDKIAALYLMSTQQGGNNTPEASTSLSPEGQLTIVKHPPAVDYSWLKGTLTTLPAYDPQSETTSQIDLRQKDLTNMDLTKNLEDLKHSFFDTETKWPQLLPKGFDPQKIMTQSMNQGLGIRKLQSRGITGKSVNIAIIDQALLVEHQEYKDNVRLYEEIHCYDRTTSMHGPSMASLAVGKNIGVAPGADLYFIANTNSNPIGNNKSEIDFTSTAQAVDRVLQINQMLPKEDKIRVISMSMSYCPNNKGYTELTQAIDRAKKAGIFVVSCNIFETYDHKFWYQGLDRDPLSDPEKTASYKVYPWKYWLSMIHHVEGTDTYYEQEFNKYQPKEVLLLPMSSKTFASPTGIDKYSFAREGGWSSVEPYLAGLYAMACQVNPDITPELFLSEALKTGHTEMFTQNNQKYKGKIIDPVKLIKSISKEKIKDID